MGPSRTQGAVSSSTRNPAMNVWVRQWPKGASASSRAAPRGDRPRRRVILVVTAVSSINISRCGSRRILGIRRWRHSYRAARTRLRSLSAAISVFFICEAKAVDQMARQHGRGCTQAVFRAQGLGQFRHGHIRLRFNLLLQPVRNRIQLASSWTALRCGLTPPVRFLRCMIRTALGADIRKRRAASWQDRPSSNNATILSRMSNDSDFPMIHLQIW